MKTIIVIMLLFSFPAFGKAYVSYADFERKIITEQKSEGVKFLGVKTKIDFDDWEVSSFEAAWLSLHVIDVMQTLSYKDDPCYVEANYLTKMMIGEEPSKEAVLAWGVFYVFVNNYKNQLVDNSNLPRWAKWTIKTIDLGYKANVVNSNYSNGIYPATKNNGHKINCYYD